MGDPFEYGSCATLVLVVFVTSTAMLGTIRTESGTYLPDLIFRLTDAMYSFRMMGLHGPKLDIQMSCCCVSCRDSASARYLIRKKMCESV